MCSNFSYCRIQVAQKWLLQLSSIILLLNNTSLMKSEVSGVDELFEWVHCPEQKHCCHSHTAEHTCLLLWGIVSKIILHPVEVYLLSRCNLVHFQKLKRRFEELSISQQQRQQEKEAIMPITFRLVHLIVQVYSQRCRTHLHLQKLLIIEPLVCIPQF